MNKEEIEKLKEKIKEFENQDVFIEIQQSIQYYTVIKNSKIIISEQKLIISDQQHQDLMIELQYLEDVRIEGNTIDLEFSNFIKITLDY